MVVHINIGNVGESESQAFVIMLWNGSSAFTGFAYRNISEIRLSSPGALWLLMPRCLKV